MSDFDAILAGMRQWIVASTNATADKVIPQDDDAPRPAPPYITIKVLTHDTPTGQSNVYYNTDLEERVRSFRQATVSVQAYGREAGQWLEKASDTLELSSVQSILDTRGFSVEPMTGMTNVGALLDDRRETRYSRDFMIQYVREAVFEAFLEAEEIGVTHVLTDQDPSTSDLSTTYTI